VQITIDEGTLILLLLALVTIGDVLLYMVWRELRRETGGQRR